MGTMIRIKRDTVAKYLLYILFFTSVDTILFGTNSNKLILLIPRIVGILLIISIPIIYSRDVLNVKVNKRRSCLFSLMLSLLCISCLYNSEDILTLGSRIIMLLTAYIVTEYINEELYLSNFNRFVYIVTLFSFLTELVAYIYPTIILSLPAFTNSSNHVFYSYFFGAMESENIYQVLKRAQAVFWEPGAFAIYLDIAIAYNLFFLKTIDVKTLRVLLLGLFITFSTTGYIVLTILILSFCFSNRKRRDLVYKKYIVYILVLMTFILLIVEWNAIYDLVFAKLTSGTSSATTRYSSLINGLRLTMDYPLFGVGSNYRDFMEYYVGTSDFNNGGNSVTNTIIAQFVTYGIPYGMIFLYGTVKYFKTWGKNNVERFGIVLAVLLGYFGEHFFSFMPLIFIFYAIDKMVADNLK